MWALVQVLPIKHNNFCLTVMNRKLSNGIAYNVFWLGEVADFQHKCLIEKLNLNFALNCYRSTSPAILPNQCQHFALLFCRVCSLSFRVCLGALAWWLFWIFQRWSVRLQKIQMCHQMRWLLFVKFYIKDVRFYPIFFIIVFVCKYCGVFGCKS